MKISIEKINEVHVRVYSDPGIEHELSSFFTFEYPGARFTPAFRARIWDGLVRLYDLQRKTLYVGLVPYISEFAKRNGYEIEFLNEFNISNGITNEEVREYAKGLDPHGRGKPITIYDYQVEAVRTALDKERTLLLSPTASGKSFIIYTTLRWHLDKGRKCIIIVPTTSLVEQLFTDFEDYSSANGWAVGNHCQKLYGGFTKDVSNDVTISTWQSIYKQPSSWFAQFDVVFGDECLHPNTKITMSDGVQVLIKNIKLGDIVKTLNETTGIIENKKVLRLHKNISSLEKVYKIKLKCGKELIVTGNHKINTESGWVRADKLNVSDKLKTLNS